MGLYHHFLVLVILFLFVSPGDGKYQCKNLQGKSVDWFVVYKLPKLSGGANGKNYLYFDSQSSDWTQGIDINDEKGGVGATISQIYNSKKDDFYIMYSDDDPIGSPESYRGHAKGVSLFDSTTGFWLIHSVPNFPSSKIFAYPVTAEKYGQSFFCASMEVSHLTELANHWRFIQATPYAVNSPEKFLTRFPTLKNVVAKQSLPRSATEFWTSKPIKTINGLTLMSYAKHRKFNGDIWNDIISRQNRIAMAVESWLNGSGDDLHTTCTVNSQTHDVQQMRVFGSNFPSSKDHSKWAVSSSASNPIVCFGDLNRQKSQLSRGGGALCIQHRPLWEIYHNSVLQVEPCKSSINFSMLTIRNIILETHSPVFHAMFNSDFREKNQDEIELENVDFISFVNVLRMIYPHHSSYWLTKACLDNVFESDNRSLLIQKNVESLLSVGNQYQIQSVIDQCESLFMEKIPTLETFSEEIFKANNYSMNRRMMQLLETAKKEEYAMTRIKHQRGFDILPNDLKLMIYSFLV